MESRMARSASRTTGSARAAFLERGTRAITRIASEISEDLLMKALAEASDLGAIARVIGSAELRDPAVQIDALAPAAARALEQRNALLAGAGEMMSGPQVAALLGISRPAVDKRRTAGRLLALRIGSDWHYPAFQFHGNEPLPGLHDVLANMDGYDPWTVLDELLARDTAMGNRSLLDVLREMDVDALDLWKRRISGDGFA